jgi:type IV secretory pathway VirB10-like protein
MVDMPPVRPDSQAPKGNLFFFERKNSVKKLIAILMTMAFAVTLGLGAVGCTKKEEKKTETKTETKTPDKGTESKTETKTETKTPAPKP